MNYEIDLFEMEKILFLRNFPINKNVKNSGSKSHPCYNSKGGSWILEWQTFSSLLPAWNLVLECDMLNLPEIRK